ncbi:MAG: hypothetical protein WBB50_00595 [Methyloceanibacter sp.]
MSMQKAIPLAALVLTLAVAAPGAMAAPAAAGNPFEALAGDWTGGGTVVPKNGEAKKVACKVTYKVAGSKLTQHLRCAGDDYQIDATTKLTDKAGKVRGTWSEAIYAADGGVTGTANADTIHARIAGDKFSSRMSIKLTDKGHEINIVQLNDTTGVYRLVASLSFHR